MAYTKFAVAVVLSCAVLAAQAAQVTAERLIAADREPGNWMAHGRNYGEERTATTVLGFLKIGVGARAEGMAQAFVGWARDPQGGHRAPGNACLAGCRALARGVPWREAGAPQAGGCGSVMRAYPFGLVFADAPERAEAWAVAHSLLTHGDPIAQAACAALARGVAAVVADAPVAEVLTVMVQAADRYSPPTARMIERAVADAHAGTDPDVVFERLQAWAAHEAVAAAAYLFARHPDDLRAALLCGANTSGDSDSIATLGGALVGARVGVQGVPDAWRVNLERSAALDALARRIGQRG